MTVRAIRGATRVASDERETVLAATRELVQAVLDANDLAPADFVSILFTATRDVRSVAPALAARQLGLEDVPLLCAQEIDVAGAMPLVVRVMVHAETDLPRERVRHVYLRGAAALRRDLAQ